MAVTFRARLARTGAQQYATGIEHRDASAVFAPESLATLANLKVQVGHEPDARQVGRVVADSYGRVLGPDGNEYLTALLEITDGVAAAWLRARRSSGISMGYKCEHVVLDGRTHQTSIRFDHVALLRSGVEQPRCGTHCAVEDSMQHRTTDAIQLDTLDGAKNRREYDRAQAVQDSTGAPFAAALAALRAHNDDAGAASRALGLEAAAALGGPRTDATGPARYHDSQSAGACGCGCAGRTGSPVARTDAAALQDDRAFGEHLARMRRDSEPLSAHGSDPAAVAGLIEQRRKQIEAQHAQSLNSSDVQFAEHLADLARRAGR